ncbi:MAG: hypothetical protein AAB601_01760 [Patescibacteria group bacterium]|mgnify:CR=1 FL=1
MAPLRERVQLIISIIAGIVIVTALASAPASPADERVGAGALRSRDTAPGELSFFERFGNALFGSGAPRAQFRGFEVPATPPPPGSPLDLEGGAGEHTCAVEPFSQGVSRDGRSLFTVSLSPSYPRAPYELRIGSLPAGMTVAFNRSEGTAPDRVRLIAAAAKDAHAGSFTVVVIYREIQPAGVVLVSTCRVNFIVE